MNKFKYGQEVYCTITETKVSILKVVTNQSNKSSVYVLDNGMTVSEGELLVSAPIKEAKLKNKLKNKAKKEFFKDAKVPDLSYKDMKESATSGESAINTQSEYENKD